MSGVGDYGMKPEDVATPEIVKGLMRRFDVSEETARLIITYCNAFALEKMNKWIRNMKKIQKEKADYVYQLTRSLKRGNKTVIDELEKKILELCVET